MNLDLLRTFWRAYQKLDENRKTNPPITLSKKDYALDATQVDCPELLFRISAFLPIDAHNTFRRLCPVVGKRLRSRAKMSAIVSESFVSSSMPLKFFNSKFKPIRESNRLNMLNNCDIECELIAVFEDCKRDVFSTIPPSLTVEKLLVCGSVQPAVLPYINGRLVLVVLYHSSTNLRQSYPFGLQDVLDRIDGAKGVTLSVCHFSDSANWKDIILRWVKNKKHLIDLNIIITSEFTQSELNAFLTMLLPYVGKYRNVHFAHSWSLAELAALKNKFSYAPKRYVKFYSLP